MVRDPDDLQDRIAKGRISFRDSSQWHTVSMKTDENNPEDWYRSAKVRLGSVDRLYPLEGMSESVIELCRNPPSAFERIPHFKGMAFITHSRFRGLDCGCSKV